MEFELKIIEILQANATLGWIRFFSIITLLGGAFGLILGVILVWKRSPALALSLLVTFAIAGLFNLLLKGIIARQRPFEVSDKILNLGEEDGFSFPSGHSLSAGVIATFLFYALISSKSSKGRKITGCITICLYPIIVAFSRMMLGVHYLTDTIAGIILGILLALIGLKVYNMTVKKIKILKKEGYDDE